MKVTTILFAVLMFGVLVTIHEFGHYLFARIFKVTIEEFSIGIEKIQKDRYSVLPAPVALRGLRADGG